MMVVISSSKHAPLGGKACMSSAVIEWRNNSDVGQSQETDQGSNQS